MLIIADKKIPQQAKEKLEHYSEVVFLETRDITYPAISGHPDIFFCKTNDNLIVAPNLPDKIKKELKARSVAFVEGKKPVGAKYPATALYNAVVTEKYLIHNLKYTDEKIVELANDRIKIDVKQAYTRCNLLPLEQEGFITSDKGIEKALLQNGLDVLYVSPDEIILQGFLNGFFGGACGVYDGKVFILGGLDKFKEGEGVRSFVENRNMEIIELFDGKLFDGGSILFI